jgi:cell division protein FtsI/penicillin-binding protein 2
MAGRTERRLRMVALLLAFLVFGSAAMLRLGYWQVVAAPDLVIRAVDTMAPPPEPKLARGEIIDRDGVTLAQSASFDRLDAHPKDIPADRREGIVETLAGILDLGAAERQTYLAKLSTDRAWDWLARRLTPDQSLAVTLAKDAGELPGISLEPLEARVYPRHGGQAHTTLASHLLGFVAGDSGGAYGLERVYEDRLAGRDTSAMQTASIAGLDTGPGSVADLEGLVVPPLRLTIDARLQRQLESELNTARIANQARSVSAVVMDPYSGAILATASVPGYDANDFAAVAQEDMDLLRDRVVSDIYEPGSVMKIFTATAALDRGVVTPETKILDQARLEFYRHTVENADGKGMGWLPVKDVIANSRNVATAKIAALLAPKDTQKAARLLHGMWDRVGLVGRTGVDMAGEEPGIYWDPDRYQWAEVDLANRAFGQGVAVTLLQLARGFSTLVNGGFLVQPHVLADSETDRPKERVLRPKIADLAQEILVHVTGSVPHYARGSLIPGYLIGGKTGTAQIWDVEKGDWKRNRFNHSFIGFVGANRPEVVIAVRIEEAVPAAVKPYLDLEIESYELFQMIARGAIKHLDIERSRDRHAGLPILGTEAARVLTPDRARAARAESRKDEKAARREVKGDDRATPGAEPESDRGNQGPESDREDRKPTHVDAVTKPRDAESGANRREAAGEGERAAAPASVRGDGSLAPARVQRGRIPPDGPR